MKKTKKKLKERRGGGASKCVYLNASTLEVVEHPEVLDIGVSKILQGCTSIVRTLYRQHSNLALELLAHVPPAELTAAKRALQAVQAADGPKDTQAPPQASEDATGAAERSEPQHTQPTRPRVHHDVTSDPRLTAPANAPLPEELDQLVAATDLSDII